MKKVVSLLLVFAIVFSLMAGMGITSDAGTNGHSQADAVEWIKARGNEHWWQDVDGQYGCQCVDLTKAYYNYLGQSITGNAKDYLNTSKLPSGWWMDTTPSPGSVIVWGGNTWTGQWTTGSNGHVGLVYAVSGSNVYTVETNTGSTNGQGSAASAQFRTRVNCNAKFIHPDFTAAADINTPTLSFNKSSYSVGETATITWTASPSGSTFKHYWLVITNTTTGKQYYGTSTGADGNPGANSYSLKLTEAGTVKVDVYAVRPDGSGKSDSKSFYVSSTDIGVPTISFNKSAYLVGETANITWTASPSNSNFKHYWLVITNTTTGENLYGTVTGDNGDVTKNYYNLKLTKAGVYKVDVYTIRNDGSGLSDSKTFNVSTVDISTPILSIDKGSYLVGETAKITWTASSSKSDLKHYWLVIKNTTNGNKYYGASVGTNSYSLKLTEAGSIKVDVYAVRNDGSGLSDSKTFTVTQECTNHSYTSKVTTAATCTATGIKTFTCSKCGNQYTQTIAALGHNYSGSVTKAATCTEKGIKTFKCSRCTNSYTQDIAALGHDIKTRVGEYAKVTQTGSSSGYTVDYCTRCNYQKINYSAFMCVDSIYIRPINTYTGKVITPSIRVALLEGGDLIEGKDYTLKYASGRKNIGKYAVKVTFKGNYQGSRIVYFQIVPKGTTLSKLTASKNALTAKWKKLGGITGYQIQYCTNSYFTGAKTVTIKGATAAGKTIKNLKAKQVYYVRVRTYKTVSGTHYKSTWSKTYKVKTK